MFDKLFSDFIDIALGMLIAALVLSSVTICMYLSDKYNEKQIENAVVSKEIAEQRNNLFYNHTHVYQQDIVALILKYKGDRKIVVTTEEGARLEWSTDAKASDYKVSSVSSLLSKDVLYDSELIWGPNLTEVVGYEFSVHQAGCGIG